MTGPGTDALREALKLARPIVESVHAEAASAQDDDWQAETNAALGSIDAALASLQADAGERG